MDKKYDHTKHEERIYKMWEDGGYFNPDNSKAKETFSVLMPPPNANAPLHCGTRYILDTRHYGSIP